MGLLTIRRLSPIVGAEVTGMDFSKAADEGTVAQLKDAFQQYELLLFRKAELSVEDQARFGRIFGKITVRGEYKPNEYADTQHISNRRHDGMLGDGELRFHCDQLFFPEPLSALMLYAIEVPSKGGETLFCNTNLAYQRMSPEFKKQLEGLHCLHAYDYKANLSDPNFAANAPSDAPRHVHPLIWTNPATGRKAIWIGQASTQKVMELDPDQSKALLSRLKDLIYDDSNVYRHRWQVGDLLIWSNRMLQHARTPFDPTEARTLRRTPIV